MIQQYFHPDPLFSPINLNPPLCQCEQSHGFAHTDTEIILCEIISNYNFKEPPPCGGGSLLLSQERLFLLECAAIGEAAEIESYSECPFARRCDVRTVLSEVADLTTEVDVPTIVSTELKLTTTECDVTAPELSGVRHQPAR